MLTMGIANIANIVKAYSISKQRYQFNFIIIIVGAKTAASKYSPRTL